MTLQNLGTGAPQAAAAAAAAAATGNGRSVAFSFAASVVINEPNAPDAPAAPAAKGADAKKCEPAGGGAPPTDQNSVASGVPSSTSLNQWSFGSQAAQGHDFSSTGDPHEVTLDGKKFDNQRAGTFTKLESASGDFVLQTRQSQVGPGIMANDAAAVKMGKDVVTYDAKTSELKINGEKKDVKPGDKIQLDSGTVTVGDDPSHIDLETTKGDHVSLEAAGGFLNVTGKTGPDRKQDEVQGELGDLHGGSSDQQMDKWATKPEDNLFDKNAGAAAGGAAPVGGGAPAPGDNAAGANAPAAGGGAAPVGGAAPAQQAPQAPGSMEQKIVEMLQQLMTMLKALGGQGAAAPDGGAQAAGAQAPAAAAQAPAAAAPAGGGAPAGQAPDAAQGAGAPASKDDQLKQIEQMLEMIMKMLMQMLQGQGQAGGAAPAGATAQDDGAQAGAQPVGAMG